MRLRKLNKTFLVRRKMLTKGGEGIAGSEKICEENAVVFDYQP